MISNYFSGIWADLASATGNHLWQSTLFAIIAGLFTLMLRKNQARTRYLLWLAASVKFLVPFSLLAGIGRRMSWAHSSGTASKAYLAMDAVSQPFAHQAMFVPAQVTDHAASPGMAHLIPALVVAVWLCGLLIVLARWCARWWRISTIVRNAVPLVEGREQDALGRVERIGGRQTLVEMLLSATSLEPGIFGIVRPVLIWPERISERLDDAHLEAILAHEMCHVRRRDNLAAAIHMLVEAIFWFHPLIWWLGARQLEERERACDEQVVEWGNKPQLYAESILKICEFCLESPLACVAGVTGSNLKKRVVHIMTERVVRKLNFGRKLLLSVAGILAVILPVAFGSLNATAKPANAQDAASGVVAPFKSVSIKVNNSGDKVLMSKILFHPDAINLAGVTLQTLIELGYGVTANQISGLALDPEKYDIEATIDSSAADEISKLNPQQHEIVRQRMLQNLLADQFKLALHRETRDLAKYDLVVAESGSKLREAKPGDTYPDGIKGLDGRPGGPHMFKMELGKGLIGQAISTKELAELLTRQTGRPVLDKTGLNGSYDLTLHWAVDPGPSATDKNDQQATNPSLFTALEEQLGLELKPQTGPVETLVIDHAEKPKQD